jgi:hypothetical protein
MCIIIAGNDIMGAGQEANVAHDLFSSMMVLERLASTGAFMS